MDKAALVSIDVKRGSELIDALDKAKLKVGAALWMFLSEYEDWRLVVSARQFDSLGLRKAFGLLHDSLRPTGFTPSNTPPILILPMADPFIRELRRLFGKTKSVEGLRLGSQMIGNRFVEDA